MDLQIFSADLTVRHSKMLEQKGSGRQTDVEMDGMSLVDVVKQCTWSSNGLSHFLLP